MEYGGINSFINEQKNVKGEGYINVILFNDNITQIIENKNLNNVELLNENSFFESGTIGTTIDNIGKRLANTNETERPDKVIIAILTDGFENSSKLYTQEKIKEMVKHQSEVYSWEFIFLAANQDAFLTANTLNINDSINFSATSNGINCAYTGLNLYTTKVRNS